MDDMNYRPAQERYAGGMHYRRCGRSGVKLPAVSLGCWFNFGDVTFFKNSRELVRCAFDRGITHFDLANNYGPPTGAAEENFGRILKQDLAGYRDELFISTKAGYGMWPGPYGDGGSRKYLLASLDQSLKRLGVEYVDLFYHHRPDPETPLEETMGALAMAVRQGKALYVGLSKYSPEQTREAVRMLKEWGTPCLIHQLSYSLFNRSAEEEMLSVLESEQLGCIAFSPLARGLLTDRYLAGIPADSRAASGSIFMKPSDITAGRLEQLRKLNALALERGQSLAQMALAWVLRGGRVTSVLIGASQPRQIVDCAGTVNRLDFSPEELKLIDEIIG